MWLRTEKGGPGAHHGDINHEDIIMNRHHFISAVSLAGLLAVSGGMAHADIVKCVDTEGHATLTDQGCPRNETEVVAAIAVASRSDLERLG